MKLTIATPTFGKPPYLRDCVASTASQTVPTAHIVCGGNLSLDNEELASHVTLIKEDVDPGMVTCWSNAASMAKTDYIGFLADDNSFHPEFAQRMINFLENNPDCDWVFCNQNYMDEYGRIDSKKNELFKMFGRDVLPEGIIDKRYYRHMLEKGSVPLEASVMRRKVWERYGPFATHAKGSFDHEFVNRLLLNELTVGFIPAYLMNFRIHDGAYTARAKKEHLTGAIWTYEALVNQNRDYADIFQKKTTFYKSRLLRYKIPFRQRINLMKSIVREKQGLQFIVKNSLAGILAGLRLMNN